MSHLVLLAGCTPEPRRSIAILISTWKKETFYSLHKPSTAYSIMLKQLETPPSWMCSSETLPVLFPVLVVRSSLDDLDNTTCFQETLTWVLQVPAVWVHSSAGSQQLYRQCDRWGSLVTWKWQHNAGQNDKIQCTASLMAGHLMWRSASLYLVLPSFLECIC